MGGSAPLNLVHGRPVATLDGGIRAVVDTAGAAILLAQSTADDLDLQVIETIEEGGEVFTVLEPPALSVDGYALDTDGLPTYGFEDARAVGLTADGLDLVLPATLLQRHSVLLDALGDGTITFDDAGSLVGKGVRVPAEIAVDSGLITVTCTVLGATCTLLLDTGVSCSLVADRIARSWREALPDLAVSGAAVGPGNMAGLRVEARTSMLRVPAVEWDGFTIPKVAFVWRADGDVAPFDGSLGANVLRSFTLGIDHQRGELWIDQREPIVGGDDTDQVGVTLVLDDEGEWEVGAVLLGTTGVDVGDRLVAVDGGPVTGVPLADVLAALGGSPGQQHHLVVRRGDGLVEADVPVARVL
ncbi:MAG: hypothetical protein QOD30_2087 [Actinomycetota bacterium]|nr:hypothetical protein [Actinomycetota bacterium]